MSGTVAGPVVPRIGMIGAGFIGAYHARALRHVIDAGLVEAELAAVCDLDPDRAGVFAREHGIPSVIADAEALIADPRINTIYICTPTAAHVDLVAKAAAAGKAVFCEKPLATTLADARRMTEAVEQAGVINQVGLVLRHAPIFTVLRKLMADADLGRPMTVIFHDDQFFPITGHYASTWRKDAMVTGGGTLIEHSIHDLDLLTWLLGPVAAISARTRNLAGYPGVEDLAVVSLEFADGCIGTLTSTWHHVLSRRSTRLLEIIFERGLFRVEHDSTGPIRYETAASDGPRVLPEAEVRRRFLAATGLGDLFAEDVPLRSVVADLNFLRAVRTGTPAWPGFDIALGAHALVDAVYRSAAQGGVWLAPEEIRADGA